MKYYTKALWLILGVIFLESCNACGSKKMDKEKSGLIPSTKDPELKEHMYSLANGKGGTIKSSGEAMSKAYDEGDEEKTISIMKFLLFHLRKKANSTYDYGYEFMLFSAMKDKKEKLILFLLEQPNININLLSKSLGEAPIHDAVLNSSPDIVRALLNKGASINIATTGSNSFLEKGSTPLHALLGSFFFTKTNSPECRRKILDILLAQPDIDVNARDSMGHTPLICIIKHKTYNSESRNTDFDPKDIEKFLNEAEDKLFKKGAKL